jgi:branched-chain amino acid transport system permease protein
MSMQLFLQQVVEGLASGAIYAALALALVLIYRATRIVNFAQGEMGTFSAFLAWQLGQWGAPFWLSLIVAGGLSFVVGVLVFRILIRPVITASENTIVNICIGLFIGFEALCLWIWGADSHPFPRLFSDRIWTLEGVRFSATNVGTLATLCVLAAGLMAMFRFTRIGLAMRASAAEREKSPLVGIHVETMLMLGWGLAAVFGFIAAVLVAPSLFLSPPMMVAVVIYALAAATLGGWDSPAGAIVGGLIIGVAESLGATYLRFIGSELKVGIPFALMAIVLLVRPQGLFGRTRVVRV